MPSFDCGCGGVVQLRRATQDNRTGMDFDLYGCRSCNRVWFDQSTSPLSQAKIDKSFKVLAHTHPELRHPPKYESTSSPLLSELAKRDSRSVLELDR